MFKFLRRPSPAEESEVAQTIKDAILLGHVEEIDAALELLHGNAIYSDDLRNRLETLRYFRAHYGAGGDMEPRDALQKQKAVLMEQAYSAELLSMLEPTQGG